jgi:molecular chaperone DnaK
MTTLIPRNTTIPTRKSEIVLDGADSQTASKCTCCRASADGARQPHARQVPSDGLPPAPRGVPQIEVTFDIDANGIVNVSAKDMAPARSRRSRSPRRAASARTRSTG